MQGCGDRANARKAPGGRAGLPVVPPMTFVSTRNLLPRPSSVVVVSLLLLALPLAVATPLLASGLPQPLGGAIAAQETWQGSSVLLSEHVTVAPGATLTLRGMHVQFAGGSITVLAGGRLEVYASTLETASTFDARPLVVYGELHVEESALRGLGGIALQYAAAHGTLVNVTYTDNEGAINVTRRAVLHVEGGRFEGNLRNAIWNADATTFIRNATFAGNGGIAAVSFVSTSAGSYAFGEAEGELTGSVVRGNGRGVHFQGADETRVRITGNLLAENFVAINLQDASGPELRGNTFLANAYAVVNFGILKVPDYGWEADATDNYWGADGPPAHGAPNGPAGPHAVHTEPWLLEDPVPLLTATLTP